MRGDCGVAGEGRLVGVPKFQSWGKCTMPINEYQLRSDVQRYFWPVYYIRLCYIYMDPLIPSWGVILSYTKATPNEIIVSHPDFCHFTCRWTAYYH